MRKEEVFVRVSSEKKARKLKEILDMFGQQIFLGTLEIFDEGEDLYGCSFDEYPYVMIDDNDGEWSCFSHLHCNKTKVSLKELRNILAKEYLKEWDVVVIKSIYNDEWVMEVDYIECDKAYHKSAINKSSGYKCSKGFLELNFIRYATEEEKALLELKKELEIGKWYKGNVDIESLIFITEIENVKYYNRIHGYGFIGGKWDDTGHLFSNTDHEKSLVEATYEEVKQELIKEAKRRYKVGDILENHQGNHKLESFDTKYVQEEYHVGIFSKQGMGKWLLYNGKWAEVINPEKSLEERVKELEDRVKELENK